MARSRRSAHTGELAALWHGSGTETAFSVLARARAMGVRRVRDVIHLEIGEPDFDHPGAHHRGGHRRAPRGRRRHYCPAAGIPGAARGGRRTSSRARAGWRSRPTACSSPTAPSRSSSSPSSPPASPATRSMYPDPGFPIYESVINWIGRDAGGARRCARSSASASPLADLEERLSRRARSSSSSTRRRTRRAA